MRSRTAQSIAFERFDKMRERSSGRISAVVSFASDRGAEIHIADLSKLPLVPNTAELQNEDGENYFLVGYSKVGGPDIIP